MISFSGYCILGFKTRLVTGQALVLKVLCVLFSIVLLTNPESVFCDNNDNLPGKLFRSVFAGDIRTIESLLNKGLDPNLSDEQGMSLLMHATLAPNSYEVSKQLIRKGALVTKRDNDRQTALMLSVSHGRCDLAKLLIFYGARVDARDVRGANVLMYACTSGNPEVVQLLLNNGADVTARDIDGLTALNFALSFMCHTLAHYKVDNLKSFQTKYFEIARLLIRKGSDVNSRGANGETPLMHAAFAGNTKLTLLLLKYGADRNAVDANGRTALMDAIAPEGPEHLNSALRQGRKQVAKILRSSNSKE
jgi:ankyrin repeat protein